MFTEEEIRILKEVANNYKQEQLDSHVVIQCALEWWEKQLDIFKYRYSYKHHKCNYKGLSEQQIVDIYQKHAVKI